MLTRSCLLRLQRFQYTTFGFYLAFEFEDKGALLSDVCGAELALFFDSAQTVCVELDAVIIKRLVFQHGFF